VKLNVVMEVVRNLNESLAKLEAEFDGAIAEKN
jgi:hypothetical protein